MKKGINKEARPSRTIFLPWPSGHPLKEFFNIAQHRTALLEAFRAIHTIKEAETIIEPSCRWTKEDCNLYLKNFILEKLLKKEYSKDIAMKGGMI